MDPPFPWVGALVGGWMGCGSCDLSIFVKGKFRLMPKLTRMVFGTYSPIPLDNGSEQIETFRRVLCGN